MPGCSRPPVISASSRKRARLVGSSACWSRICLSATSRLSSASSATKTAPSPPRGMGPQDAEPQAVGGGGADGVAGRAVGVGVGAGAEPGEGLLDRGVAQRRERLAGGGPGGDGGKAPLEITVFGDVQVRHRLDHGPLGVVEMTEGEEMVGQGPGLVQRPGLESGHELDLVDQPVLKREQSEEEMAVSGDHDKAPIVVSRSGKGSGLRGRFRKSSPV